MIFLSMTKVHRRREKGSELAAKDNGEQSKMTCCGMRVVWVVLIYIGKLHFEEGLVMYKERC